jgi:hypothetical protein
MGNRKDVLVDMVSKAIVRSQSTCLAAAQNAITIEVGRARNISITDMKVMQKATSTSRCSQNVEVDIGSLQFDVQKTLDAAIQVAAEDTGDSFTMKNNVTNSFKNEDVKSCLAQAVNDFKIKFGTVGGNVDIYDLRITQVADARVTKCIQEGKFKVGELPVDQYIGDTLKNIKSIKLKTPEGQCGDPKLFNLILYGVLGLSGLIVVAVVLWHFLTDK